MLMLGTAWLYVWRVMTTEACPSSSWPNFGCVPLENSSDAQV